jgi:hypothetical protein
LNEQPERPASAARRLRWEASCKDWSDRILLFVAVIALAFFVWNGLLHGVTVREAPVFQNRAQWVFLLLCAALAFSLFLEARHAWEEGIRRREIPSMHAVPAARERSFRSQGPAQTLFRLCTEQLDKHFRRFYAFHHYQNPHLAYFYYAKKGSVSLTGPVWMKTGFLLFFLIFGFHVAKGWGTPLTDWQSVILGAGCLLVAAGLLISLAVSYRKVWVRIVQENDRVFLTVISSGRGGDTWFEGFYRSIETHSGVVSCSTHSRYGG